MTDGAIASRTAAALGCVSHARVYALGQVRRARWDRRDIPAIFIRTTEAGHTKVKDLGLRDWSAPAMYHAGSTFAEMGTCSASQRARSRDLSSFACAP